MFTIEMKNLEMKYNTCFNEIEKEEDIIYNNEIAQLKIVLLNQGIVRTIYSKAIMSKSLKIIKGH